MPRSLNVKLIEQRARYALSAVLLVGAISGCGGNAQVAQGPVRQQTPEEEILSIGSSWEARYQDNGLRSEPSKISVFALRGLSALDLTQGQPIAHESVVLEETFKMRDGRQFGCRAEGVLQVQVRFFRKGEEPAVEVTRPDVALARHCDQPGFPEPTVSVGNNKSSYLLREEQLVAFEPPLEKRSYIPVQ
jgi:hypothetical protein